MTPLAEFEKANGPRLDCQPAAPEIIRAYQDRVPDSLSAHWADAGFCGYAKGLLWITNPDDFTSLVKDWFGEQVNHLVFARTALADLFLWSGSMVVLFNTQYGKPMEVSNRLEIFFNYSLCKKSVLDNLCSRATFAKARRRLGSLSHDECYGYVPAVALGGSETVESLQKVKLREYLAILAQAVRP